MEHVLNITHAPDAATRTEAALLAVRAYLGQGTRAAWVFPSADLAAQAKKRLADSGKIPLGVEMGTLGEWVRGRWALYGDGRALASDLQRLLLCRKALGQAGAGSVECLAQIARAGAGIAAFDGPEAEGLSPAQAELVGQLRAYRALLAEAGLVEPGEACALLANSMPEAGWHALVLDGCCGIAGPELALVAATAQKRGVCVCACLGENPAFEVERTAVNRLVDACSGLNVSIERTAFKPLGEPRAVQAAELASLAGRLFDPRAGAAVEAQGHLRACLPSGRYARPELLARQIQQLVELDRIAPRDIAVVAKDPLGLALSVADRLAECAGRGIAVSARGKVRVSATAVGRYALAWATLFEEAAADPDSPRPDLRPLASDLARNPLTGIGANRAARLDRDWRLRRDTGAGRMVADLLEAAPRPVSDLATLLKDLPARLGKGADPNSLAERAAAEAISQAVEAWCQTYAAMPSVAELAELMSWAHVTKSLLSVPPNDIAAQRDARVLQSSPNAVRFMGMEGLDAASFGAVILCDLTATAYPVDGREDVKSRLWDALGLEPPAATLPALRRSFRASIDAAREILVLERPLNNEDAQAVRPCALLEEILDCYRDDPSDLAGLERTTGLPKGVPIPLMTLGEEEFSQLVAGVTYLPAYKPTAPATLIPSDPAMRDLAIPRDGVWSPSGLEALLSCPCRWLHERRLPNGGVDAAFDGLATGSLAHLVLHDFHERMTGELGLPRISRDTPRKVWEPLLDECFALALRDRDGRPAPLVAVSEVERRKLEQIREQLRRCVARDALLPEGFVPHLHEWSFGDEGQPEATVGGVRIHGTIDRVDVDPARGLALVLDYKGALDEGHRPVPPPEPAQAQGDPTPDAPAPDGGAETQSPEEPLPRHSQILMYLRAFGQARPDLALAGGLYVSYRSETASGFLDPACAGPLPDEKGAYLNMRGCGVRPAADGTSGLAPLLDRLDEAVERTVAELQAGRFDPAPRFGKLSCRNCPVSSCPRRES